MRGLDRGHAVDVKGIIRIQIRCLCPVSTAYLLYTVTMETEALLSHGHIISTVFHTSPASLF